MKLFKKLIEIDIDEFKELLEKKTRLEMIAEITKSDKYISNKDLLLLAGESVETVEKQEEE